MAQSLPQRALGKSGINASAIGLGCMSFSGTYGASNDDNAIAVIKSGPPSLLRTRTLSR